MNNPHIILLSGELRVFDMPDTILCKGYICACENHCDEYPEAVKRFAIKNAIKLDNPELIESDCSLLAISTKGTIGRIVEAGNPKGFVPYKEGDQFPLPKGLKVEISKYKQRGEIDGPEHKIARLIKEPVNKEPFSESKLHETFDGPEITEGAEPVIKLTFYSGKLWHSDKPFPVKPKTNASILEDKYLLEVRSWLSTAYEVTETNLTLEYKKRILNHNNISCGEGAGWEIAQAWDTKAMFDGDQITLPEGYGIEYILPDRINGFTKTATITLPEKTENSADGHTDLINKFKGKVKDLIEIRRSEHDSNFNYVHQEKVYDLIDEIFNELLSEPSESQEELAEEIVNVIWNLGDTASLLHCKNYIKEHYILTRRK